MAQPCKYVRALTRCWVTVLLGLSQHEWVQAQFGTALMPERGQLEHVHNSNAQLQS